MGPADHIDCASGDLGGAITSSPTSSNQSRIRGLITIPGFCVCRLFVGLCIQVSAPLIELMHDACDLRFRSVACLRNDSDSLLSMS